MPESLLDRIIKASSNIDGVVLDPFGGTGTTAYVSKKLKRNYITVELSEKYYDNITKRLNKKVPESDKKGTSEKEKQIELFN